MVHAEVESLIRLGGAAPPTVGEAPTPLLLTPRVIAKDSRNRGRRLQASTMPAPEGIGRGPMPKPNTQHKYVRPNCPQQPPPSI